MVHVLHRMQNFSFHIFRELKQTTTTTATRTSLNRKSFNKKKQWLCTCAISLCTFLCSPLQNNNVKWPNPASSTERARRRLFRFGIERCHYIFSLHTFFRAIGFLNRSTQSRIRLVNYKSIFFLGVALGVVVILCEMTSVQFDCNIRTLAIEEE